MTREKAIKKAVDWWCNKVCGPVHHDNGDHSYPNTMAMLFADLCASPVSNTAADIFKAELSKRINEDLNAGYCQVRLNVDYCPCEMLSAAAEAANIDEMNFPFKTNMFISGHGDTFTVEVSDGYAKPYINL